MWLFVRDSDGYTEPIFSFIMNHITRRTADTTEDFPWLQREHFLLQLVFFFYIIWWMPGGINRLCCWRVFTHQCVRGAADTPSRNSSVVFHCRDFNCCVTVKLLRRVTPRETLHTRDESIVSSTNSLISSPIFFSFWWSRFGRCWRTLSAVSAH